jgi:hypothetical protein
MLPRVYVEITVVSYLVASQVVLEEASQGDAEAVEGRLAVLAAIPMLVAAEAVPMLARDLAAAAATPANAVRDALHIAIAAVSRVDYRVTWNCKHLAIATLRVRIGEACRSAGLEPRIICTPYELMAGDAND